MKWINEAIKHPGAELRRAARAGAMTAHGTIREQFLKDEAKKKGRRGREARLALELRRFRRDGRR